MIQESAIELRDATDSMLADSTTNTTEETIAKVIHAWYTSAKDWDEAPIFPLLK